MEFDSAFEVPLPPDQAWPVLIDIPRIAPCMPGAELTEVVDPRNYKGTIAVRLGPVALAFAGRIEIESIDDRNHVARVKAQGTDAKGRGGADATATFRVTPEGAGSKVLIHADLTLSGAVAQYGARMIEATATEIVSRFADNLRDQLAETPPLPEGMTRPPSSPMPGAAPPISGLSLIAGVVWSKLAVLFGGGKT